MVSMQFGVLKDKAMRLQSNFMTELSLDSDFAIG